MKIAQLPEQAPTRGNGLSYFIGRSILSLSGWEFSGEWPRLSKCVIIVAPHTSNWDFIIGLAAAFCIKIRVRWLGKDSLFKSPLAWFFRWQGGIPAVRDHPEGLVGSIVEQFKNNDKMWLALAPEGTRSQVKQWRSGFYHMAQAAQVPIVPVALDWGERKITIFEAYQVSGDYQSDLQEIQQLYQSVKGLNR